MRLSNAPSLSVLRILSVAILVATPAVWGFPITFTHNDFTLTPIFNSLQEFSFLIDVDGPLVPGTYINPALNGVQYSVQGTLNSTPSGFPAFNLQRTIGGTEFYAQGSSLRFTIAPGADLSNGLQISDLQGPDPVFVFDGREVGTGRYHPPLFQLNSDGTGSIRNSNNSGGVNPSSQQTVNVNYGDEYIVNLAFDPAATSLSIPEPGTGLTAGAFLITVLAIFRRQRVNRS